MKLDMDCVRDVLLEVEAKSGFCRFVSFPSGFDQDIRNRYSDDALRYHIDQCFSSGLLVALDPVHPWDMAMNTTIKDLARLDMSFYQTSDRTLFGIKPNRLQPPLVLFQSGLLRILPLP